MSWISLLSIANAKPLLGNVFVEIARFVVFGQLAVVVAVVLVSSSPGDILVLLRTWQNVVDESETDLRVAV